MTTDLGSVRNSHTMKTDLDLHGLFDQSSDLVQAIALNHTLRYTNATWQRVLGYGPEAIANGASPLRFLDVVHPGDRDRYQQACTYLQNHGSSRTLSLWLLTSSGNRIPVSGRMSYHRPEPGQAPQIWCLWRVMAAPVPPSTQNLLDLQSHLLSRLSRSEDRFRSLYERSSLGISTSNLQGRLLEMNEQFCQLTGHTVADLVNRSLFSLIHPDDRPAALAQFKGVLTGKTQQGVLEQRYITRTGAIVWVQITRALLKDRQGHPSGVISMVQNVDDRKRAEQEQKTTELALQASEARFRTLVQNVNVGIVVHDAETKILLSNLKALELLGLTEDQLLGKTSYDPQWSVIREDQSVLPGSEHPVSVAIATRQPVRNQVIGVQRPSTGLSSDRYPDQMVWLLVNADPQFNLRGEIQEVIVSFADITYRKHLENKVLQALQQERELNDMRSRLVSTMSHEFRTPLTVIQSASEILPLLTGQRDDCQEYYQQIWTATKHMTQMLDDVLWIGKLDAGQIEVCRDSINLTEFCQESLRQFELAYPHYQFQFDCTGPFQMVRLDPKLLRPILNNLLSNAVKYSPPNSEVMLWLIYHADHVLIQVQDHGIGIPEADQQQLFNAFYRARNAENVQGTGLGLAIVKQCVDLQGGQISLNSQVNAGTTFTVTLPMLENRSWNSQSLPASTGG